LLCTNNKTSANVSPNNKGWHNKLTRALGRTCPEKKSDKKGEKKNPIKDDICG
jgi:hypothetical protein